VINLHGKRSITSTYQRTRMCDRLRHQIYEIEWETGEVICAIVRSRQEWHTPRFQQTPFTQAVDKEAILL